MFIRFTGISKESVTSFFCTVFLVLWLGVNLNLDAQDYFNDLENSVSAPVWINTQIIDSIHAYSGSYYAIADSVHPYGLGIKSTFPEKYRNKNTILKVEGWVKSNKANDLARYVISLVENNKQVLWQNINLSPLLKEKNHWYYFSDSIRIPASVTKLGSFKTYLWNEDQKDTIGIDDLKISFSDMSTPSFLPKKNALMIKHLSGENKLLFKNAFFKLYYSPQLQTIQLSSIQDFHVINNIFYYTEREKKGKKIVTEQNLIYKSKSIKGNTTIVRFVTKSKLGKIWVNFCCSTNSPEIKIEVKERFNSQQLINRESLVIYYDQDIREVYRSNRKTDINNFQPEYWLGKEGVKSGDAKGSFIAYHATEISSLQLHTKHNQLWVNLDYEKDHPFLHFPLNTDTTDYFQDWSASIYKKGDKRKWTFSVYVGTQAKSLPRLMKNPGGYLATYIWTEHADFTNIRTNRATYFGSENITIADSAVGGFVRYQIPVTKSVFYANPDSVTNSTVSNQIFNGFESSIKADSVYFDFLKQLWNKGVEICLHSPDNFTTNRKILNEALLFMLKEFHSKSWIDHGYNNGITNNREDLVCDGTLKNSPYFAMDLWKKFGLNYFWNPYYEDYQTFRNWKFSQFLDNPYHGYGDMFPNPDFWKNPTRTGNLILWPTKTVMYMPNNSLWNYYFTDQVLKWFTDSWSVEINHCYPAWVDPDKGFWVYDTDSTIIAAPGFNLTLQRMAALRDKKLLNVTTIEQFGNYQTALQNMDYQILPDGRVKITNNNSKTLIGLSLATRAKEVVVNGLKPFHKKDGADLIFWFDIKPNESKIIRVIK